MRTKKLTLDQKENYDMAEQSKLHVMLRWLSRSGGLNPMYPELRTSEWLDRDLSEWVGKGYDLVETTHINDTPEGIGFAFVFRLREP